MVGGRCETSAPVPDGQWNHKALGAPPGTVSVLDMEAIPLQALQPPLEGELDWLKVKIINLQGGRILFNNAGGQKAEVL